MDKKYIHGSLVVDGDILEEFKSKRAELQRRLKSNQFNPDGYDLMNDRQQDIFIAGIFVDPMQAEGIDNYIEFGYDNCECPDVMDELYETCPALMSKVDKFKDRKDAQTRVTIEYLDRMMDMVIQEQLTARPLVQEKLSRAERKAQAYEEQVVGAMKSAQIESGMFAEKIVDASATGPDAEFAIKGTRYFLEIKADQNAQMGDVSIYYNPKGNGTFKVKGEERKGRGKFGFAKPETFSEELQDVIYRVLNDKEPDILNWVKALKDDRRKLSYSWEDDKERNALFKTTFDKYEAARAAGLLKKAGAGYKGAGDPIPISKEVIEQIYNSKKIYYMQIGGKGLYYVGQNPAKLPIPPLEASVNLELRPRPSSRGKVPLKKGSKFKGRFLKEPQVDSSGEPKYKLDKKGNKTPYKVGTGVIEDIESRKVSGFKNKAGDPVGYGVYPVYKLADDKNAKNQSPFVSYGGTYSVIPRLAGEGLKKSPYSFDDEESIKALAKVMKLSPDQGGLPDRLAKGAQAAVKTPDDPDYEESEYFALGNRDEE